MSREISDLSLEVQKMVKEFLAECIAKGHPIFITTGQRSWEEQAALYAQGRMDISDVNVLREKVKLAHILPPENIKVTNAPAGFSPHNFGRAIDIAFHWDKNHDGKVQPGEIGWDGDWYKVGQIGESIGFEWGGRWVKPRPDKPHFQFLGGWTLEQLRGDYALRIKKAV